MMRYRDIFHDVLDLPDDPVFTATLPPWWFPEWGDPATTEYRYLTKATYGEH